MRTPIARTLLLTIVLAACSADSSQSLSSEPGFVRSANADTKTKHISGTLETVETGAPPTPGNPIITRRLVGTGIASHLGEFTLVGDIVLNLATASGTGTRSYTAANGDVLTVTSVGQAAIAAGVATVTETVTVTRGTGRFAGATGTLTVIRRVVQATGAATGTIDGTITIPK